MVHTLTVSSERAVEIRELLVSALSPALGLPRLVAWCLSYAHPTSRQRERVYASVEPETTVEPHCWAELDVRLPPNAWTGGELPPGLTALLPVSCSCLYALPLETGQPSERLLILTDHPLTPAEQQQLQAVTRVIASHLNLWQAHTEQQAQTTALADLLGSVEHQMRQSLGLINLYLSRLEGQSLTDEGQAVKGNLQATVADISDRLDAILTASAVTHAPLATVDLQRLIRDRGQTFAPSLQAQQITLQMPDHPVWLQADPHQLGQVIDNLLCNAISFSPIGGTIAWSWDAFDGEVLVQICDQGPGISPGAGLSIFQPGYTERPQGHGWGLTITQKIVAAYGGRIWANNTPQGGAQFSVIFPQIQPLQ
ncbi:MAG: HAMP domain-containing sensor histidine kinase [Cyanobacteria bacterium P01_H01_bin.162]